MEIEYISLLDLIKWYVLSPEESKQAQDEYEKYCKK